MSATTNIAEYLLQRGVKPSYQRIKILDYLIVKKNHPTVNDIYQAIVQEIPTLSKTTVYNTLKLFIEHGIVIEVLIEENEVRYDFAEEDHGHFKCARCGMVVDFKIPNNLCAVDALDGFTIVENHVYLKGLCPRCQTTNH